MVVTSPDDGGCVVAYRSTTKVVAIEFEHILEDVSVGWSSQFEAENVSTEGDGRGLVLLTIGTVGHGYLNLASI